MLKHCSDEEKLEQNSGKRMLPEKTLTRPGNLLLKTKQFQGSCVCLLNMTRPFIRSRKSCTKDCLDQDLSLSPSQLVGLYWFGNGCFHYSIAFSGSRGSKPSRSESTCRIRFCFKKTIIWDYRHVRLLIFVMCTPSSLSCNPYELCVDMFNNEMDSLSLSLCVCGRARLFLPLCFVVCISTIFAPLFHDMHKHFRICRWYWHHICPLWFCCPLDFWWCQFRKMPCFNELWFLGLLLPSQRQHLKPESSIPRILPCCVTFILLNLQVLVLCKKFDSTSLA